MLQSKIFARSKITLLKFNLLKFNNILQTKLHSKVNLNKSLQLASVYPNLLSYLIRDYLSINDTKMTLTILIEPKK